MSFNHSSLASQLHTPSLIVCLHRESDSAGHQEVKLVGPVVTLLQNLGRFGPPWVAD